MWSKSTGIKLLKLKLVDVYFLVLITGLPSSCSLYEKITESLWIQQRQGEIVLLSESNSNISAHLARRHL